MTEGKTLVLRLQKWIIPHNSIFLTSTNLNGIGNNKACHSSGWERKKMDESGHYFLLLYERKKIGYTLASKLPNRGDSSLTFLSVRFFIHSLLPSQLIFLAFYLIKVPNVSISVLYIRPQYLLGSDDLCLAPKTL